MKYFEIIAICALLGASGLSFAQTSGSFGGSGTATAPAGTGSTVPGGATTTTGVPGGATATTGVPGGNTTTTGVPGGNTLTNTTSTMTGSPTTTGASLPSGALTFQGMDSNNDGSISHSEFDASGLSDSLFSQIDANHDGIINQDELNAHAPLMKPSAP